MPPRPHGTALGGLPPSTLAQGGLEQAGRRRVANTLIKVGQVPAIQLLEIPNHRCRVVIAKPPEPVRAFTQSELMCGRLLLIHVEGAIIKRPVKMLLGLTQQVPGPVLSESPIQVEKVP